MGIGDWGLGIGDWGLGAITNAQCPKCKSPKKKWKKKILNYKINNKYF